MERIASSCDSGKERPPSAQRGRISLPLGQEGAGQPPDPHQKLQDPVCRSAFVDPGGMDVLPSLGMVAHIIDARRRNLSSSASACRAWSPSPLARLGRRRLRRRLRGTQRRRNAPPRLWKPRGSTSTSHQPSPRRQPLQPAVPAPRHVIDPIGSCDELITYLLEIVGGIQAHLCHSDSRRCRWKTGISSYARSTFGRS